MIGFWGDRPLILVGSSCNASFTSGVSAVPPCSSTRRTEVSTAAGTVINRRPILPAKLSAGFVANFAQEVMKGQSPWSVEGLRGQGVEQFGRSAALVSGLHHHLSFLDHVHELNPNQGV